MKADIVKLVLSALVILCAMTLFGETVFIAPMLIGVSVVVMFISLVRLCRKNKGVSDVIISILDAVTFWTVGFWN